MKNKSMHMNVPYYSQRLDVKRAFWRPRACGIVSLKMAMDYMGKDSARYKKVSIDQLIDLGVALRARDPEHGWIHNGLVAIAKLNGFKKSYRQEWEKESHVDGIEDVVEVLAHKVPVLASMMSRTGGHLIILVGLDVGLDGLCRGFFYHDPKSKDRNSGKNKKISINKFTERWKGRIIVVKK